MYRINYQHDWDTEPFKMLKHEVGESTGFKASVLHVTMPDLIPVTTHGDPWT